MKQDKQEIRPRFRDLGFTIGDLEIGNLNSITDVPGVKVGHCTIIEGNGKLIPGKGPVRTGVTVILPHEKNIYREKVRAGYFVLNGYGKT
ncbi:MAG: P1 family peptidase, partial [Candidatus Heimdallarchaeota archaeon]|nr:P1 family peptidase [Candidatus Heimdallarchaeota archaeon]